MKPRTPLFLGPQGGSTLLLALLFASLLLLAGWLLPAATSAALVLHEIEHEHGSAAPAAMVALFHGLQ